MARGTSSERWLSVLRFGVPGALAGLLLSWMVGLTGPPAAQAEPGLQSAGNSGLMAFTTTAAGGSGSMLYLIDPRAQSFAIYRVDGLKGSVRLEAARHFRHDLRLAQFNNLDPEVAAVEAMVSTTARGSQSQP